ncbi:Centrosomal protein of 162 kDa [Plasmodiophora brassicae]|uniref:Uncharacterized protein n=1 Tax=Plasmodiophora brassicae TaxID=37360 RepID=A0A0G4IZP1_PLABS|nr:hypothetical protein PBRA_001590 [Plasmodiophora brassicae]SPQ93967.1 unnamed protein product [Plasmodiophora brassicae]
MDDEPLDVFVNVDELPHSADVDDRLPDDPSDSSDDDLASSELLGQLCPEPEIYQNVNVLGEDFDWDKFGDMHALRDEVEKLSKSVDDKNAIIVELQDTADSLRKDLEAVLSQDVQEVCKGMARKNKSLRLQVTRLTNENARLLAQVNQLHEIVGNQPHGSAEASSSHEGTEARLWKSKYAAKSARLQAAMAHVNDLKNEVQRLKLVLKAEVGDDEASFERALNGHPDWKGRASEVARLTAKLRKIAGATARAQVQNIPTSSSQTDIDRLQKERSAEKADLLKEISQHQKEVSSMRMKLEAASARNRTLADQVTSLKSKLRIVIEKSMNDDKLIDGLRKQAAALDTTVAELSRVQSGLLALQRDVNQKQETINLQDKQICELERTIVNVQAAGESSTSRLLKEWDIQELRSRLAIIENDKAELQRRVEMSQNEIVRLEKAVKQHDRDQKGRRGFAARRPTEGVAECPGRADAGPAKVDPEEYERLQHELEASRQRIAVLRRTYDEHIADLQTRHARLLSQCGLDT